MPALIFARPRPVWLPDPAFAALPTMHYLPSDRFKDFRKPYCSLEATVRPNQPCTNSLVPSQHIRSSPLLYRTRNTPFPIWTDEISTDAETLGSFVNLTLLNQVEKGP